MQKFLRKTSDLSGESPLYENTGLVRTAVLLNIFVIWNATCNPLFIGGLDLFPTKFIKYIY